MFLNSKFPFFAIRGKNKVFPGKSDHLSLYGRPDNKLCNMLFKSSLTTLLSKMMQHLIRLSEVVLQLLAQGISNQLPQDI